MPLKFECNQDPRKMKSAGGKKFCEQCGKHVFDVRRKGDEKILDLRQKGECLIIYADQLKKVEAKELRPYAAVKKTRPALPYAAGLALFTLASASSLAQKCPPNGIQHATLQVNAEGKPVPGMSVASPSQKKTNELAYSGKLKAGRGISDKDLTVTLIYIDPADSLETEVPVVVFECDTKGLFSFTLTPEQAKLLDGKKIHFVTDSYDVTCEKFIPAQPNKKVELRVNRRLLRGF
jgi:hypothetical protein